VLAYGLHMGYSYLSFCGLLYFLRVVLRFKTLNGHNGAVVSR